MSNKKNSYQMVTLKKVFRYIKRYIPLLIVALTLSVVTVALTLFFPILTGRAIDLIVGKGQVDFAAIMEIIVKALIVVLAVTSPIAFLIFAVLCPPELLTDPFSPI